MNDRIEELESRMAALERELYSAREQLSNLRHGNSHRFLAPTAGLIVLLAISGAVAFASKRDAPAPLTVKAPFTVVDDAGKVIMFVQSDANSHGIGFKNRAGAIVAQLSCDQTDDRGFFKLYSPDHLNYCQLAIDGTGQPEVRIATADKRRTILTSKRVTISNTAGETVANLGCSPKETGFVLVGTADGKTYSQLAVNAASGLPELKLGIADKPAVQIEGRVMRLFGSGGAQAAAIGDTGKGGTMYVNDAAGGRMVQLTAATAGGQVSTYAAGAGSARTMLGIGDDLKAGVNIYNAGKANVARLSEAPGSASGHLAIGSPTGEMLVEAGNANGAGLVRTGPAARALLPGVPGSYILGKQ